MAAYQCLNCHQIENIGKDCCSDPDLFCVNDLPAAVAALRDALKSIRDIARTKDDTVYALAFDALAAQGF